MSRRSIPPYSGFPYREDLARLEAEADEREQRQRKDSTGAGGAKEDVAVRKSKAKKKRNRTKSTGIILRRKGMFGILFMFEDNSISILVSIAGTTSHTIEIEGC